MNIPDFWRQSESYKRLPFQAAAIAYCNAMDWYPYAPYTVQPSDVGGNVSVQHWEIVAEELRRHVLKGYALAKSGMGGS